MEKKGFEGHLSEYKWHASKGASVGRKWSSPIPTMSGNTRPAREFLPKNGKSGFEGHLGEYEGPASKGTTQDSGGNTRPAIKFHHKQVLEPNKCIFCLC